MISVKRPIFIHKLLFVVLCVFSVLCKAQFYNLPNDYFYSLFSERRLAKPDSSIHTNVKPYIHFFSDKYIHEADSFRIFKYITEDVMLDKAFFNHLIHVKTSENNFRFTIDPLLNVELGRDRYDTLQRTLSTNTRGFIAAGHIGKDFYFETMLAETQSYFPDYIASFSKQTMVVPGQGRWKTFKKTGFDYAYSSGFFSYQPIKNINIQAGHGKHKIGHGYRSLFLSDNAFNYPYLRLTQQWFKGRMQYSNIYATLMNLESASTKIPPNTERLFQKKAAAFQHLSLNLGKHLNIGFFQGMIWETGDKNNRQNISWQYFNPLIFSNMAIYKLNNKNNVLIGSEINLKLTKSISMYGQFMADDLSNTRSTGNGIGYQIGIKYFDFFKLKNWFLQAEYNDVSESAYTNPLTAYETNQSYSHYNQNLAFTPGYGKELVVLSDYKIKRFFINAKYNYQFYTLNGFSLNNNQLINLKLGYTVNPAYNANISLGLIYRNQDFYGFNGSNNKTAYVYLSFKTSLNNTYFDF